MCKFILDLALEDNFFFWKMLTGAPGALVKEAKVEAFALKIV
jgi:hypothetical protein